MCAKLVAGSKELCRAECVLCWCPIGEEGLLLKARGECQALLLFGHWEKCAQKTVLHWEESCSYALYDFL